MSMMMILLGMAFICVGGVYLAAPNVMWERDRIFNEGMGLRVARNERWYAMQRIVAAIAISVGIAIIALEITTPTQTLHTSQLFVEPLPTTQPAGQ